VVAGGRPSSVSPWAADHVGTTTGPALLAAVEAVVDAESSPHADVAAAEVEARLGLIGVEASAQRRAGGLRVVVRVPVELDAKQRETLGVQVAAALRHFDTWVEVIDVSIISDEEERAP
jgi:hypothetical protein